MLMIFMSFCSSLQLFCNSVTVLLVVVVINRGPEFWYLFTCQCACVIHCSDDTILPHFRPKVGNPFFRWHVVFSWWINGNRTLWGTTNGFIDVFLSPVSKNYSIYETILWTHMNSSHLFPALSSVKSSVLLHLLVIIT